MQYLICSQGEPSESVFIPMLETRGYGVELQGYGLKGVQSKADWQARVDMHQQFRDRFNGFLALHGPFIGVNYCHNDYLFREAVQHRLEETFRTT